MNDSLTLKEQKRADSDGRILRAAAKIFGTLGYSQATLTGIAEEAGVSQGLVSQRFHSKENLLHEVFDQTQILSFYDDENRHLPRAFYVLLDHLKQEASEEPEWFRFLSMIHTGTDTPQSFEDHAKEMFLSTPLCSAIAEAQAQKDLPDCDPWDIFRVFFRNATNLIGWYHEFGLPMPENEFFLYAIQYNRSQKEAESLLQSQKYEIRTLQTDREILFTAVSEIYPLIVFSNLTKNSYHMLEYEHFHTKRANEKGVYDDLIRAGVSSIPSEVHREQFQRLFGRENVIRAYQEGKQQLYLRHLQTGDDGIVRWIETRMLFKGCECGEILTVTLSRPIDDEIERLHSYGEALQKAELAAGAKSRFLSNLSHEIRTPMNAVIGYTDLIRRHTDQPERVRNYAEKMRSVENELMELLASALDAANLTAEIGGTEIRFSINESSGGILANAEKIARQKGVTLDYRLGTLHDDYIYADELRLQKIVMSLIFNAINISAVGDRVSVSLEQPEAPQSDNIPLRLTVHTNITGINDELLPSAEDDSKNMELIMMDLAQIREDIRALGGTLSITSEEDGSTVVCEIRFRRVD